MPCLQVTFLVQTAVLIMPCLNQVRKPKSKHNTTLHEYSSTLTPYDLPNLYHFLQQSRPPVSLSHPITASTLSSPSRPHASPSLLSTTTIKSHWAINHYSARRNHAVSNPSSSHIRRRPPLSHISVATFTFVLMLVLIRSHLHHYPDASPNHFP